MGDKIEKVKCQHIIRPSNENGEAMRDVGIDRRREIELWLRDMYLTTKERLGESMVQNIDPDRRIKLELWLEEMQLTIEERLEGKMTPREFTGKLFNLMRSLNKLSLEDSE